MKISYNWLKWYVPQIPEVDKLADIVTYHLAEVESMEKLEGGDVVLDIKILPNRAHDLLSHQGVARELASLLEIEFKNPEPLYKIPNSNPTNLKIKIDTDKCRRYAGRIIKNIKIGSSPAWVVEHLESIGQRSINNIVDATNTVMYDSGQPTHAFDLDKVDGGIIVRQARDGEQMTALDNKEVKLSAKDMVIADNTNILAIAGVKGGKSAEVDSNTKNIIIEVANFDPVSVRKTAQSANIQTDSKKRFENDLSPELVSYGMKELSGLIMEICPEAVFEDIVDEYPVKQEDRKLSFSLHKVSKVLGVDVTSEEMKSILDRYNIHFEEKEDGIIEINVPPMRLDFSMEEDIAEEVARIMGYDKIVPKLPKIDFKPQANDIFSKISWSREKLLNDGYSEVMTYVFRNKGDVEVLASASDKKFLRVNLSDGVKESLKLNQLNSPLLEMDEIKIFEIGTVFKKEGEEIHVCIADKKEVKEMSLEEFCKSMPETSPGTFFQVSSEKNIGENSKFKMWSLYPFIARDIAVWVPEIISSADVEKIIKENIGDMVVLGPKLFDEFKKDGKVSYAFKVIFQSYERTLSDEEINTIINKITEKLNSQSSWSVR
ncbi:MAG: phenylalanine--tRNA ligase subunit beta [Patescibacteria group bacterium]